MRKVVLLDRRTYFPFRSNIAWKQATLLLALPAPVEMMHSVRQTRASLTYDTAGRSGTESLSQVAVYTYSYGLLQMPMSFSRYSRQTQGIADGR